MLGLPHQLVERCSHLGETGYELAVIAHEPHHLPHLLGACRTRPVLHHLSLLLIDPNPIGRYDMTKELHLGLNQVALLGFQLQATLSKPREYHVQPVDMRFEVPREN